MLPLGAAAWPDAASTACSTSVSPGHGGPTGAACSACCAARLLPSCCPPHSPHTPAHHAAPCCSGPCLVQGAPGSPSAPPSQLLLAAHVPGRPHSSSLVCSGSGSGRMDRATCCSSLSSWGGGNSRGVTGFLQCLAISWHSWLTTGAESNLPPRMASETCRQRQQQRFLHLAAQQVYGCAELRLHTSSTQLAALAATPSTAGAAQTSTTSHTHPASPGPLPTSSS